MKILLSVLIGFLFLQTAAVGALVKEPTLPFYFFEEQVAKQEIRYVGHTPKLSASFSRQGVQYGKQGKTLTMEFKKTKSDFRLSAEEPLPGKANFLFGQNPEKWRKGEAMYSRLRYVELFEGIDLTYEGVSNVFKSEYHVKAGADAGNIEWQYTNAEEVKLDMDGQLRIKASGVWFEEHIPEAYELDERGGRILRKVSYELRADGRVGFKVESRNAKNRLVIDPVLVFSTYLGGRLADAAASIALDTAGNIYVAGWTESKDFPVQQALYGTSGGGVDAYVVKFSPNGQQILWATYLGGAGDDRATSVAVDASGNVVVGGWTQSSNFPVNGSQNNFGGIRDGFVVRLNANGNGILFSTYVGGSGSDAVNAVAVDASGVVYAVGETTSTNFPTTSAYQAANQGGSDAFLVSYQPAGDILFRTLFGGTGEDRALALAVDSGGSIYVGGTTNSADLPLNNALQATRKGGQSGFIVKFPPAAQSLSYSTYWGGSRGSGLNAEQVNALALDAGNNLVAAGITSSSDFPTTASVAQIVYGGGTTDGFVTKFNAAGTAILASSFFGGKGIDAIQAVAVDATGIIHLAGSTTSRNLPVISAIPSSIYKGGYDAFYARVRSDLTVFDTVTYIGGTGADQAMGLALSTGSYAYLVGNTLSPDFPTKSAYSVNNAGSNGAFLLKLNELPLAVSVNAGAGSGSTASLQLVFSDGNGAGDITSVQVLMNNSQTNSAACSFIYAPASGQVTILADNGSSGSTGTAGSSTLLQNSQCKIPLNLFTQTVTGNQLALQVGLQFLAAFNGNKNIYGQATDQTAATSGYQTLGTFIVGSAVNVAPTVTSTPVVSGSGYTANFTTTISDANGSSDITQVLVLINTSLNGSNGCFFSIDVPGRAFYLAPDITGNWTGVTMGTSAAASNTMCRIVGSDITFTNSGTALTVNIRLTFQTGQTGTKAIYVIAYDQARAGSPWVQIGSWALAANQPPQIIGVSPNNGSGSSGTFTFTFADPNGFTDLGTSQALMNTVIDGNGACYLLFDRPSQKIYLLQNSGSFLGSSIGSGSILSNSQCTVNAAAATISGSGNTLVYTVPITFLPAFRGTKNIYLLTADQSQASVGWTNGGTFTVQ